MEKQSLELRGSGQNSGLNVLTRNQTHVSRADGHPESRREYTTPIKNASIMNLNTLKLNTVDNVYSLLGLGKFWRSTNYIQCYQNLLSYNTIHELVALL